MSVVASSLPHSRASLRARTGASNERSVVAVGRGTLIGAGVVLCGLAVWAAGATWWLVNHDAVAAGFLKRQTALQYAYEDRIAALRAQIDRVASQRLLEQDGLEGRVSDLIARQVQLETRQAVLTTLAERAAGTPGGAGARAARTPQTTAQTAALPGAASAYAPAPKAVPAADFLGLRLREAAPAVEPAREGLQRTSEQDQDRDSAGGRLADLDRSLRGVEAAQARTLDGLVRTALTQVSRIRTAVIEAGLDPNRLQSAVGPAGGPLMPLPTEAKPDRFVEAKPEPFERLAAQAAASFAQLESLRRATAALPFGRPMAGAPDLTSGFGARLDPFTRGAALHTGLDFRADYGAPVRAAGAGRVIGAEYAGGYGNMVEIDHGDGVTTRYAHLSAIAVGVGQTVAAGTIIGRVGSTGRSTGAHLHYETRINDEPVDPQRFLRAGLKLSEAVESAAR